MGQTEANRRAILTEAAARRATYVAEDMPALWDEYAESVSLEDHA